MSNNARRQLLFEVGDHLFAADARSVLEVLEPVVAATPVPGSVPGVRGLINLRGTLLVAGNLGTLLGLTPKPSAEPMLVVLEHEAQKIALEVDRVVDVAALPGGELDVDGQLLDGPVARSVVGGVGDYGRQPYFLLDMHELFALVLEQDPRRDRATARG